VALVGGGTDTETDGVFVGVAGPDVGLGEVLDEVGDGDGEKVLVGVGVIEGGATGSVLSGSGRVAQTVPAMTAAAAATPTPASQRPRDPSGSTAAASERIASSRDEGWI